MITGKPAGNVVPTWDCARTGIAEKINNSPTAAVAVRFIEIPPSNWLRAEARVAQGIDQVNRLVDDAPGQRASKHEILAARAIRNNPAPTTMAPMALATRSPAGARRSTEMAAATTAIARTSMTPMTRRTVFRPAQQWLQ